MVLSRALAEGRALLEQGVEFSSSVAEAMRQVVESEPLVRLDYAVAVGQQDLVAREVIEDPAAVRLLIAAEVGPVRLIDNCRRVVEVRHRDDDAAAPARPGNVPARHLERIA